MRKATYTDKSGWPSTLSWRRLAWVALLLLSTIGWGVSAFMFIEGWGFADALYTTLLTLTTVGLEPPRAIDGTGRLIVGSLMILGVTLLLVAISLISAAILEMDLSGRGAKKRMRRQLASMEDHYIVCAYGRVGRTVARELEAEGVPFVVIEKDEHLEERLSADGVTYVIGDPASEQILNQAGVERARGLVSAVDSDAENVYIVLAARVLNPKIGIVARASEPTAAERLYRSGVDRVISPYVTSGRQMALAILRPRVLDYFYLGPGTGTGLRIEEVRVEANSRLVGRPLQEVIGDSFPLALRHSDGRIEPSPARDCRLEVGDLLVLLGDAEALRPLEE